MLSGHLPDVPVADARIADTSASPIAIFQTANTGPTAPFADVKRHGGEASAPFAVPDSVLFLFKMIFMRRQHMYVLGVVQVYVRGNGALTVKCVPTL